MAETVQLKAVITAKDNATKEMKKVGTSVGDLAKGFAVGQLAVDAFKSTVRATVSFLQSSIKEFSKQEMADARLRAGLKNTTQEWERGFKELSDYASQLQRTTTFADEQTISAQAMLATFMLNSDQIKKLTPSILDMAAALEKTEGNEADLQQISILLGKAIGGEDVEGLAGALRRVGVVMTKAQTEILKTGTMEQRLDAITTIVSQNFGGFASETAQTYTGKLKIMQNQIGDVKEKFGEALLRGLQPFVDKLNAWLSNPDNIRRLQDLANQVGNLVMWLGNFAQSAWNFLQPIFSLIGGITQRVRDLINAIRELVQSMVTFKQTTIDTFKNVPNSPLQNLGDWLKGGRAGGGIVQAGVPVTVGERGAEMFVPSQNGRIYRQDQMPMGEISVNFNNVSVRNDNDLQTIITAVKQTLRRDSLNARLGI